MVDRYDFSSSRKFYSPNKIYLLAPCWFLKLYQSVAKPFPAQVPLEKKKKTYLKSSCNTIQKFKLNNLPGNHGSALQQVSHNQDTSLSLSEAGPPRNRHGSRDLYMQVYWRVFQWEGWWKEPGGNRLSYWVESMTDRNWTAVQTP